MEGHIHHMMEKDSCKHHGHAEGPHMAHGQFDLVLHQGIRYEELGSSLPGSLPRPH